MSTLGTQRVRKDGLVRLAGCVLLAMQTCACTGVVSGPGSDSEIRPSTPLGVPAGTTYFGDASVGKPWTGLRA